MRRTSTMRRPRSVLVLSATGALALSLAACGGGDAETPTADESSDTAEATPEEEPAEFDGDPNDIVPETEFGEPYLDDRGLEIVIEAPEPTQTTETGPEGTKPYAFAVSITNTGTEVYEAAMKPGTNVVAAGRSARFIDYPSNVDFGVLEPGQTFEGDVNAWLSDTDDVSVELSIDLGAPIAFATANQLNNTGEPSGPGEADEEDVTLAFGETHTWSDGISVTASEPKPYSSDTVTTEIGSEGEIYEVTIVVTNESGNRIDVNSPGTFAVGGEDVSKLTGFANDWKKGKEGGYFGIGHIPNGGTWTGDVLLVLTDPSELTYDINPLGTRGHAIFTS